MSARLPDVLVAGGGVAGLLTALALVERGARVRLADPGGPPSASAVAAGMVAPAMEALFDPLSKDRFPLLAAAAARWPALLARASLDPAGLWSASGALVLAQEGEEAALVGLARRLDAMGAGVDYRQGGQALFTPDEARVVPSALIAALRAELLRRGASLTAEALAPEARGRVGELVICAGAGASGLAGLAPELDVLQPIRGQVLAFAAEAGPAGGPTLRSVAGGYLAPQPDGAVSGGTMEPGRLDLTPDPAVAARLRGQAALLSPPLAGALAVSRVGVRASTPDGLPLVGRSATGAWLNVGMRRNGWLLAPLAAEIVAGALAGEPAPPESALFAPDRFGPGRFPR